MPISTRATPGRRRLDIALLIRALVQAGARALQHHGVIFAADRPATVPQVEAWAGSHRILLRGGERGERADIAPVGAFFIILHARHRVLGEVVGVDAAGLADARQHVAPEVDLAELARLLQHALEHLRPAQIGAPRTVAKPRVPRDQTLL